MLALVPLLVSLALRGANDAPAVHADLADTRWDELVVHVQAGETLAGVLRQLRELARQLTSNARIPTALGATVESVKPCYMD